MVDELLLVSYQYSLTVFINVNSLACDFRIVDADEVCFQHVVIQKTLSVYIKALLVDGAFGTYVLLNILVENYSTMKKLSYIFCCFLLPVMQLNAQLQTNAATRKTWFISSAKEYKLPAPFNVKAEVPQVLAMQKKMSEADIQQMSYWNAGAPGYRWQDMMNKLWMNDTSRYGALANMLLGTSIYDATVVAWEAKSAYNRPRPYEADKNIKRYLPKPESASYPCEYSVAAGAAVTILSHFYPNLADSVNRMAQQLMSSRVKAGMVFPSDTKVGYELGKTIAEKEIEYTKDYITKSNWDGKVPDDPKKWRGKYAMYPFASLNKTVVLTSANEFRPGPPPDFEKEMMDLKNYKQSFRSQANAFYWASQDFWTETLNKKIFENNLQMNPLVAARIYASAAVAAYDGFIACFDAKYAYWGIRPNQYDTTYKSLVPTPPFPGYPSGHAMMSGMFSELYSYYFPGDSAYFRKKAKDAAESRFQAGIHFRTDNEVGLELGRKVAAKLIDRLQSDGSGKELSLKWEAYTKP